LQKAGPAPQPNGRAVPEPQEEEEEREEGEEEEAALVSEEIVPHHHQSPPPAGVKASEVSPQIKDYYNTNVLY